MQNGDSNLDIGFVLLFVDNVCGFKCGHCY